MSGDLFVAGAAEDAVLAACIQNEQARRVALRSCCHMRPSALLIPVPSLPCLCTPGRQPGAAGTRAASPPCAHHSAVLERAFYKGAAAAQELTEYCQQVFMTACPCSRSSLPQNKIQIFQSGPIGSADATPVFRAVKPEDEIKCAVQAIVTT
jgi:hypothetical protein